MSDVLFICDRDIYKPNVTRIHPREIASTKIWEYAEIIVEQYTWLTLEQWNEIAEVRL